MLFEVTFINKHNDLKKFITAGKDEDECIDLAKSYIKQQGGTNQKARISKIRKLP